MSTRILKKTGAYSFGFFMILSFCLIGCAGEKSIDAKIIVEKSIEAHGGLDTWESIKILSFDKTTTLFNADGTVEKEIKQNQSFKFQPELKGIIRDIKLPGVQEYSYDGKNFWRMANDSVWKITDSKETASLRSSFFAAHYVICQPFELLKDNVKLHYIGITEVNDKQCHEVQVVYENASENSDKWAYYFDVETYELLANKVILKDHTSWIENLTFDTSGKLKFNAHRKSYRLNEKGEKTYLRAEYFYKNFKVTY